MAFSIMELLVVIIVVLLPIILGLIMVIAAVMQKTGTSDVLSWASSGSSGDSDPYQELQDDGEGGGDDGQGLDEESAYSASEYTLSEGLSHPADSDYTSETASEHGHDHDRQSEPEWSDRRSNQPSDKMSEYTYDY